MRVVPYDNVATFAEQYTSSLPVTFVLGFYVSIILNRWWVRQGHVSVSRVEFPCRCARIDPKSIRASARNIRIISSRP